MTNAIKIIANSAMGIYIPQHAAESLVSGWTISDTDREILAAGPDNEKKVQIALCLRCL